MAMKAGKQGRGPQLTVELSNALSSTYLKEEKMRKSFLDKQIEDALAADPTYFDPPPPQRTLKDATLERLATLRAQQFESTMNLTAEQKLDHTVQALTQSHWRRCNPGMTLDSSARQQSVTAEMFVYREDEFEPVMPDKRHNRRRDDMTDYLNAQVRYKNMSK